MDHPGSNYFIPMQFYLKTFVNKRLRRQPCEMFDLLIYSSLLDRKFIQRQIVVLNETV